MGTQISFFSLDWHPFLLVDHRSFDASLRQRNACWGVRDLEVVIKEAELNGLTFLESVNMPANNLVVLFRRNDV
jgi:Protein of unknown function (DUF938)